MKSVQNRYFNCLKNYHYHEKFKLPIRNCLAALTVDPFDLREVRIDQT